MRTRKLVLLTLVMCFTLTLPSSTHAGFFSSLFKKFTLSMRILLGFVRNKDVNSVINNVQGIYNFPQLDGLTTFKARMIEMPTRQAQDFSKQETLVKYESNDTGGKAKIEVVNAKTVSKNTQKAVFQGTNLASADEFARALFPPALTQERNAYPNVKPRRKPMFLFSFFCNDVELVFKPNNAKSYSWKIDSAAGAGKDGNDAAGLAGGSLGTANGALGELGSGLNELTNGSLSGGIGAIMDFLNGAASLLTKFTGSVGNIQGMLNQAMGQVTEAQNKVKEAQDAIAEGKGKLEEVKNQLDKNGKQLGEAGKKVSEGLAKLEELAAKADELLAQVNALGDKIQGLGAKANEMLTELLAEASGLQGQIGQAMDILNALMSFLGGDGGGAMSLIQQAMGGMGQAGGTLGQIAGIVDSFAGAGSAGGTEQYGEKSKSYVIQPTFTIRAIRSEAQQGPSNGAWSYVFSKPVINKQGGLRLQQYTWLGVKYYYFPFPQSITVRSTKTVSGFQVPRHILNVNWDTSDFPPLKIKLMFFLNQQVNVPLGNMGDQTVEEEEEVADTAQQEKEREEKYKDLKDAAEEVSERKMAAGHIKAGAQIGANAAASGAYETLANVLDHLEEIVKNDVITETATADAGRAAETHMKTAADNAKSLIDQVIGSIPVKKDDKGNEIVGPADLAKIAKILKGICPPTRAAAAGSARAMEALAAATDATATRRASELKFNRMREWALRAEAQADLSMITSKAEIALRAMKIAQAFEAQSKKDFGQVAQMASTSAYEALRAVKALEKANAGTGGLLPNLTLKQRIFEAALDQKLDDSFESNPGAESDNAEIETFGEYDPYDKDGDDRAEVRRGPFNQKAAEFAQQALDVANQIADSLPVPGLDFVSSAPPNTETLKKKLALVKEQVNKLNEIRQLEAIAARFERLSVLQTKSRNDNARSLIGAYAGMEQGFRKKAEDLIKRAATIGDDPTIITEEWTKPGKFQADNVFSTTNLKKLNVAQLAQMVAAAQAKVRQLSARAKQLSAIALQKENLAFNQENAFITKLLGAIIRNAAKAAARTARAFEIATTLCGASFSEKKNASDSATKAQANADQANNDSNGSAAAKGTADNAHNGAHKARIDAILALIDESLAEEELGRLMDVFKQKTKDSGKTPGGQKNPPGTTGGDNGTGGGNSVDRDKISEIQDAMNEEDIEKLIDLLIKLIKERGEDDPLGRLAMDILQGLLEDALRALEEARETGKTDSTRTITIGQQIIINIIINLPGSGVGNSAKDLLGTQGGLGSLGGFGSFGNDSIIKIVIRGVTKGTGGGSGGGGSGAGSAFGGISSNGNLFGGGSSGSGGGSGSATNDTNKEAERLFQLAQTKEKEGNVQDALKLYDTIVKDFPKSEFAGPSQERIKALMGDPNNQKEIESGAQVFLDRGVAFMEKADRDGAIQMFNVVLNDFPTSPQAPKANDLKTQILSGGGIFGGSGSTPTGGGGTPSGFALDPQGKIDEAAQLFADAQAFEKQGAFADALKNYNTIVGSFPDSAFAKPSGERLTALMGDAKIKQAIEDQAAVLMSRGAGLLEQGNLTGALQMFNTVSTDFPTSRYAPEAKTKVADIQARLIEGK